MSVEPEIFDKAYKLAEEALKDLYTEAPKTGMEAQMRDNHLRSWAAIWLQGYKYGYDDGVESCNPFTP
jgi:hypothetical protein